MSAPRPDFALPDYPASVNAHCFRRVWLAYLWRRWPSGSIATARPSVERVVADMLRFKAPWAPHQGALQRRDEVVADIGGAGIRGTLKDARIRIGAKASPALEEALIGARVGDTVKARTAFGAVAVTIKSAQRRQPYRLDAFVSENGLGTPADFVEAIRRQIVSEQAYYRRYPGRRGGATNLPQPQRPPRVAAIRTPSAVYPTPLAAAAAAAAPTARETAAKTAARAGRRGLRLTRRALVAGAASLALSQLAIAAFDGATVRFASRAEAMKSSVPPQVGVIETLGWDSGYPAISSVWTRANAAPTTHALWFADYATAGTGSPTYWVLAANPVSVLQAGAMGNNVALDGTALQNAVDYAQANAGVNSGMAVTVPAFSFAIERCVRVWTQVRIAGLGDREGNELIWAGQTTSTTRDVDGNSVNALLFLSSYYKSGSPGLSTQQISDLYLQVNPVKTVLGTGTVTSNGTTLTVSAAIGTPFVRQATIVAGSYNTTTGFVTLTLATPLDLKPGSIAVVNAAGSGSVASINGAWTASVNTASVTVTYYAGTGLTLTITGGTVSTCDGIELAASDGTNQLGAGASYHCKLVQQLSGTPGGVGIYQMNCAASVINAPLSGDTPQFVPGNLASTTVTASVYAYCLDNFLYVDATQTLTERMWFEGEPRRVNVAAYQTRPDTQIFWCSIKDSLFQGCDGDGVYGGWSVGPNSYPSNLISLPVTAASWASTGGGEATFTVSSAPPAGVGLGTVLYVEGASPSGYNGYWTVVSTNSTTVVVSMESNPGSWSSGGALLGPISMMANLSECSGVAMKWGSIQTGECDNCFVQNFTRLVEVSPPFPVSMAELTVTRTRFENATPENDPFSCGLFVGECLSITAEDGCIFYDGPHYMPNAGNPAPHKYAYVHGGAGATITSSGTTMSVSGMGAGSLMPGDYVGAADGANAYPTGTRILAQTGGTPGGDGNYLTSSPAINQSTGAPGNLSSTTVSAQPVQNASTGGLAVVSFILRDWHGTTSTGAAYSNDNAPYYFEADDIYNGTNSNVGQVLISGGHARIRPVKFGIRSQTVPLTIENFSSDLLPLAEYPAGYSFSGNPIVVGEAALAGDQNYTVRIASREAVIFLTGAITANRNLVLSAQPTTGGGLTTDVGKKVTVRRTGSGASTVSVVNGGGGGGNLANLATGNWAAATFDDANWDLVANG